MLLVQAAVQIVFLFSAIHGVAAMLRERDPVVAIAGGLTALGVAGLAVFWATWALGYWGQVLAGTPLALAFATLFFFTLRRTEATVPIAVAAGAALALYALVHGNSSLPPLAVAGFYWTHPLPGDNGLPYIVSSLIQQGGGIRGPIGPGWLSSDRPPLQSGIVLLAPLSLWKFDQFTYQSAAIACQTSAALGLWALVRSFAPSRVAMLAMLAGIATPVFLVNAIFVWPKLLSAGLLLCAIGLYFYRPVAGWAPGALCGALCALAMLSHGTSAFMLIGMAGAAIILRRLPSPAYAAAAVLTVLALYSPWVVYQAKVDPPGNRLAKWHLAGVIDIDPRSVGQAMRDEYGKMTISEFVERRIGNAKFAARKFPETVQDTFASLGADDARQRLKRVRIDQFFGVLASIGLLGLLFYLLPAGVLFQPARPLAVVLICYLLTWWGLTYLAHGAVPHTGSYAAQLGVVALVGVLANSAWWPTVVIVTLNISMTAVQYALR